jgi:hypothetical protein
LTTCGACGPACTCDCQSMRTCTDQLCFNGSCNSYSYEQGCGIFCPNCFICAKPEAPER